LGDEPARVLKVSDLLAQFPFAHTIEMTHRLAGGALEVETMARNESIGSMPVAMGFHPYFRFTMRRATSGASTLQRGIG
jgi:galactose mutarotase-like enzyme